jgi:hypothetical protein
MYTALLLWRQNTEENAQKLHKLPNYHMHAYGGGGIDGEVELGTYDWGQVSILRYPPYTVDCVEERKRFEAAKANAKAAGHGPPNPFSFRCKIVPSHQAKTPLPVKTLKTVMAELGHTRLDVLKLDIEGSEVGAHHVHGMPCLGFFRWAQLHDGFSCGIPTEARDSRV